MWNKAAGCVEPKEKKTKRNVPQQESALGYTENSNDVARNVW